LPGGHARAKADKELRAVPLPGGHARAKADSYKATNEVALLRFPVIDRRERNKKEARSRLELRNSFLLRKEGEI
jgi:hypothetical protein